MNRFLIQIVNLLKIPGYKRSPEQEILSVGDRFILKRKKGKHCSVKTASFLNQLCLVSSIDERGWVCYYGTYFPLSQCIKVYTTPIKVRTKAELEVELVPEETVLLSEYSPLDDVKVVGWRKGRKKDDTILILRKLRNMDTSIHEQTTKELFIDGNWKVLKRVQPKSNNTQSTGSNTVKHTTVHNNDIGTV